MPTYMSLTGASETTGLTFGLPEERNVKRLFFYDDFEDDTPKVIGVTAAVGEVSTDAGTEGTVTPFSATKMLKVQDADAATQQVYYKFGKLIDGKIGVKIRWFKNSDTSDFQIKVTHYDKVTAETYIIQFLEASMKWRYWNAAGAFADITGGGENIADSTWNEVYLILDLTNIAYSQIVTNGLNIDLGALAITAQTAADAATEGNTTITFGTTTGAINKAAYYDELAIYVNEV